MLDSSSHKAAERRRKPGQRLQLACEPCKEKKLRCDRGLPVCEQCYKRFRESACRYTERGLRHLSAIQNASTMREKIERVESIVMRIFEPPEDAAPEAGAASGVKRANDTQQIERQPASQGGQIKLSSGGSTQWVVPVHWESMIDDISDVKTWLELIEDPNQSSEDGLDGGSPSDFSAIDTMLGVSASLSQEVLIGLLPPRADMDRFVAAWFNAEDPTRVIVHAPTFQAQYQEFWLNQQGVPPAWLALLIFTGALGAEITGQGFQDGSAQVQASRLSRLGTHALVLADATRPQPFLIEALILHAVHRLFRLHDVDSHIWQILGQAVRLCYQAGYHRDPSQNSLISTFDGEMRRRVWMVMCELEISVSHGLGVLSGQDSRVCDARLPANLDDADFSPQHMSPSRSPEDCTIVQAEICYTRLAQVLGEITISYHQVQVPSREELRSLEEKLSAARNAVPSKLKMKPLEQSFIDSPRQIVDRLRLEFMYLKALCALYRRFLGEDGSSLEHTRCVDAALMIVNHCWSMLRLSQPGCQLAPVKLMLVRHLYDFNFGAMILCTELRRQDTESSAEADLNAQRKALMDARSMLLEACCMWNLDGIPSPMAKVALNAMISYLQGDKLLPSQRTACYGDDCESDTQAAFNAPPMEQPQLTTPPSIDPNTEIGSFSNNGQGYFHHTPRDLQFLPESSAGTFGPEHFEWPWSYMGEASNLADAFPGGSLRRPL